MTAGTAAKAERAERQMNADRPALTDAMWARVEPMLPGKAAYPGVTAADNRQFLEAALWRFRTGSPRCDLPERFGKWNSVFKRFRRWALKGVFNVLPDGSGLECLFVGGTIVQAHQKASGAKGGPAARGTGRSRGGLTSKIVAVALGYLVRFAVLPGQSHDLAGTSELLEDLPLGALTEDKAFDAGRQRRDATRRMRASRPGFISPPA